MLNKIRKNNKGFTLVEVIVVAVIVAVLALVAIQLYQGYVTESRQNTAENLGASAASFAQSAINSGIAPASIVSLGAGGTWTFTLPNSQQNVTFTCPQNAIITVDGNNITASVGPTGSQRTSDAYPFNQ